MTRQNLFGLSRSRLSEVAVAHDAPDFHGGQMFRHLYRRRADGFDAMTDLPAALREMLAERWDIRLPEVAGRHESADGSVKLVLRLEDGFRVETVAMPERPAERPRGRVDDSQAESDDRPGPDRQPPLAVCVSTQVGCPLACSFCRSGTVPFRRNLTAGEIAAQVLLAETELGRPPATGRRNIVFMGMGEPLLNTTGVLESLDLLTDPDGFAIPARRITVSTVGLPEEMKRLGREAPRVGIAVSLHAPSDETRRRFMPIANRHPISDVFDALRSLPPDPRRRVTIEYTLLGGENDRSEDARDLVRRLGELSASGIRPRVNLIVFNRWPGAPHRRGDERDAERFLSAIASAGFTATLRRSRGDDVAAACGQLAAV